MGLDVYLYRYEDYESAMDAESKYEKMCDEIWDTVMDGRDYSELTEAEKDTAKEKLGELDQKLNTTDGESNLGKGIEFPSTKYPKHLFKVGYFRSSYNDTGINNVLNAAIGKTLYDLFPHSDDDYSFRPNWKGARELAVAMLAEFQTAITDNGSYRAFSEGFNMFRKAAWYKEMNNEHAVLKIFQGQLAKKKAGKGTSFNTYSNAQGTFFLGDPLKIRALIPGFTCLGEPCVWAVYEDEYQFKSYIEALEIVIETIDYVLAQNASEKYYLHWSG